MGKSNLQKERSYEIGLIDKPRRNDLPKRGKTQKIDRAARRMLCCGSSRRKDVKIPVVRMRGYMMYDGRCLDGYCSVTGY